MYLGLNILQYSVLQYVDIHTTVHVRRVKYSTVFCITANFDYIYSLKGQCHKIFDHFFGQKTPSGPHMNRKKRFREIFRFREDFSKKRVST